MFSDKTETTLEVTVHVSCYMHVVVKNGRFRAWLWLFENGLTLLRFPFASMKKYEECEASAAGGNGLAVYWSTAIDAEEAKVPRKQLGHLALHETKIYIVN